MMKKTVAFAALGSALLVVSTAFAQTPGFSGPEIWAGKCIYITGKSVKTHAPCSIKVYANAFSATEVWEWENGTRTVVKESDKGIFVNDQAAEKRNASGIIDVKANCVGIKATDEIYCSVTKALSE